MSDRRSIRRVHLARHLCGCGPRPVLEALLAVEGGDGVDDVLADFGRLPVETYRAVGADDFPVFKLRSVK
jgi:hypothetical protein